MIKIKELQKDYWALKTVSKMKCKRNSPNMQLQTATGTTYQNREGTSYHQRQNMRDDKKKKN